MLARLLLCGWLAAGCGAAPPAAVTATATITSAIVYGQDDRCEYFEVGDGSCRGLFEESAVALMPRESAERLVAGDTGALPTWAQADALCAGEPFADQPAAAFCS